MKYEEIPQSCPHGHTEEDLKSAGIDWEKFERFIGGQTVALCEGEDYDHELHNPHGVVYYGCDVRRFLRR